MCSETSLGLDDLRKSFYSSGLQSELQDFSWPFPCRTSVLEATCAYSGCCEPWRGRAWQWEAASADGTEPSLLLSSLLSGLKWHVEGCWCAVILELCSEDSDPTGSQIKDWWIALRWSLPWTPLLHATLELASLSYCSCSSLLKDLLWKMRMGRLTCYPCNSSQ